MDNKEYVGVDDKYVPENDQNENKKNENVKNDGKKALIIGIVCFAAVIGIVFIITFVFIFNISLGIFNKADKMMDRTLNTTDKVVNKTIDKMNEVEQKREEMDNEFDSVKDEVMSEYNKTKEKISNNK